MAGSEGSEMAWVEVPLPPGVDRVEKVHWHLSMEGFERARARVGVLEREVYQREFEDGTPDYCFFETVVGGVWVAAYGRANDPDRAEVTVNDRP